MSSLLRHADGLLRGSERTGVRTGPSSLGLGPVTTLLVLCGVFFNETRAFDLLRFVRREFPALPFVACRIGDRAVAPVMAEAMGIAAKSMGAVAFIDSEKVPKGLKVLRIDGKLPADKGYPLR